MKTVELIHPPHLNSTDDRLDAPSGLLNIVAYLRHIFISSYLEVRINDLSGLAPKDWNIGVADIYGITVYVTSLKVMKLIAAMCKLKNPKSIVVVGGAHPSALPESPEFIENDDVDVVVVGDGEVPMYQIVSGKFDGKNGKVLYASEPDEYFLFPAFDLVDVNSYHRRIDGLKSLPLLATIGCPFSCSFCGLQRAHELNGKIKFANPENICWQVRRIIEEFDIHAINFMDDQFTLNKSRLFKLLDLIKPLNIKFRAHGRAGYDTEEVYAKLAEAGCVQVSHGIESGSQYILDRMNKQATVQDNYNVIQWAKKYGITSRAFFVIGFPGETKKTLEETKKFILEADPDQVFVSTMVPYPGTEVYDHPENFGIKNLYKDFDQYFQVGKDGLGGLLSFDTEWLTREEFRELEIEFRLWIKQNVEMRGNLLDYEKKMYKKE